MTGVRKERTFARMKIGTTAQFKVLIPLFAALFFISALAGGSFFLTAAFGAGCFICLALA